MTSISMSPSHAMITETFRDTPAPRSRKTDDVAPAIRGLVYGTAVASLFWVVIAAGVYAFF